MQNEYFVAFKKEFYSYLEKYSIVPKTIYVGGGNPGCVQSLLEKILSFLNDNLEFKHLVEFTVECNPVNVNRKFVSILLKNKVSRISLGVQTFDEKSLLKINRIRQNNEIVENALYLLGDLKNVSIDLINGLPEVNYENELKSLDRCLRNYKNLNHISFYDLTIDENAYFSLHKKEFSFPKDEEIFLFEQNIENLLKSNNFIKYEISNWARNSQISHHNLAYWNYENYLGLGASAHSKIDNLRIENKADIKTYINERKIDDVYILTEKESLEEMLLMGLRTIYGISKKSLKRKCGKEENFNKLILFLLNKNVLKDDEDRVILNDKGRLFLDSILVELFRIIDSF